MASVLVADANVLIDLEVGGLLRASMRLPDDIVTVDIITAELAEASKKAIRAAVPGRIDVHTGTDGLAATSPIPSEEMARRRTQLKPGDEISIPWGLDRVRGTVHEVYGPPTRRYVVVLLTPSTSEVVAEDTTVTLPLDSVTPVGRASS